MRRRGVDAGDNLLEFTSKVFTVLLKLFDFVLQDEFVFALEVNSLIVLHEPRFIFNF